MKTIRSKMLLALFASMLVTVAFTVLFFIHLFDDILLNQVKQQLKVQTEKAVHIIHSDELDDLDNDSFRFFVKDILFYADFFVIDDNNNIVASSISNRVGMNLEGFPGTPEGYMLLNGKKVLYSEARLSRKPLRIILYSQLSSLRALYIPLFRTTLLSIAASFFVILIIGLFAVWRTVQPLNRLKEAVNQYEPNTPNKEAFLHADSTEIGQLIHTFQLMSNRLDDHHRNQLEFLQNVSHELKTPLMSIQGYVYAIHDQVVSPEQGLDIISAQSQRLIDMVSKLIQLSRLETVEEEWPTTTIDLKSMAEEAVYILMPGALQRGIQVVADAESLTVKTAGEQLFQILLNLLQNAVRHTHSRVNLTLEQPVEGRADWIFHVDDDGPGLNENDRQHLFKRFYTGNNGVTGLGLAISKQLATRLHADLTYSDSPLGGARFSLIHYPEHMEI